MTDRNEIARRAFNAGQKFSGVNGSGLSVPDRLAADRDPRRAKIGVAMCCGDMIPSNFAMALGATEYMLARSGMSFFLIGSKSDVPAKARNRAVEDARKMGCDWMLFLDGRTTFPPNAFLRLIQAAYDTGVKIAGVATPSTTPPHENLAAMKDVAVESKEMLVEVEALPASFLLVKMEVFDGLEKPYFRYPIDGDGELGDDSHAFCRDAQNAGFGVWLDVELSQFVAVWGEMGWRLTGDENQPVALMEVGAIAEAPETANESKIEIAK